MSTALQRTRAHLGENRQTILLHSLAAAFAGLAPVPYLDEWLPSLVRRQLVRRIAESRGVDIDEEAVRAIADGRVAKGTWRTLIGATPILGLLRRSLRTAVAAWNIYRRAEVASRTFALATLFDHYCARVHVGGELGGDAARELRDRIDRAVAGSMGSLPAWAVKRAFASTLRVLVRAPSDLLGALRQRRLPEGEVEAEEIVEESLAQAGREDGPLARAARGVDAEAGRSFVDELIDAFERSPHA